MTTEKTLDQIFRSFITQTIFLLSQPSQIHENSQCGNFTLGGACVAQAF